MKPDINKITIHDNKALIVQFIEEMLIKPRITIHKWSKITNQTPNLKIGYPVQHLASLILGIKGSASGARGDDIADGTEVKSCSLVDQSDKCNNKNCKKNVLKTQTKCPYCGSTDIKRNFDSKWLIAIHSEDELKMATKETDRFLFVVTDYPDRTNFNDIRIRAFEVYPKESRGKRFVELLENYYNYIYLPHIEKNKNLTPAPKNLFPDMYPFYMCNPVKIFECIIKDSINNPQISVTYYIEPDTDRSSLESEPMPKSLLSKEEKELLFSKGIDISRLDTISESLREYLPLRDTDKKIKEIGTKKTKLSE